MEEKAVSRAEKSGVSITETGADITLEPGETLSPDDVPTLLAFHGLKAEDWTIERITANKWDVTAVIDGQLTKAVNRQLKVVLKPSASAVIGIQPARIDGPIYQRPPAIMPPVGGSQLYVIFPDQQIPHHDKALHQLALRWLEFNKPTGIICSGDIIDQPTLSKHRHNPHMVREKDKALQDGLDQTYAVLSDYLQACNPSVRKIIPGNHEERFQNYLIDKAPELYGIKRAGQIDPHSAFSIPHLIRSDELGFDWVTAPNGSEWPDAEFILSPYLAIRHGWLAAKGSGMTALKTLEHLGYSVVVGHTHRQGIVFKTVRQIDGLSRTLTAVEAGTMAESHEGLGYSIASDWQQGFAVIRMFREGTFDASLAKYVNGCLIWEGQRWFDEGPKGIRIAA